MTDLVAVSRKIDNHLVGLTLGDIDRIISAVYIVNLCEMDVESRKVSVEHLKDYIDFIGNEVFEDADDAFDYFKENRSKMEEW